MADKTWVQPSAHDLLVMVRDVIRDRSQYHNQLVWIDAGQELAASACELRNYFLHDDDPDRNMCGSRGCAAGIMVALGDDPRAVLRDIGLVRLPSGRDKPIGGRAAELASLDALQANWLFAGSRTHREVLRGLDALIADQTAEIWDGSYNDVTDVPRGS